MRVLGIGESVVDTINIISNLSAIQRGPVLDSYKDAGGPVLAGLIFLARSGQDCTFATSLGRDAEGRFVTDLLKNEGVKVIQNKVVRTKQHTVYVKSDSGERSKHRGNIAHAPIQGLTKEFIQSFDLIILDRHERKAFHEVVQHKRADTILITDPSTEVSMFTLEMMRHSDVPIIPIESLVSLATNGSLAESLSIIQALCNKPFVVTLGELGSLVYFKNKAKHVPPYRVNSIDSTGAGDIFRAAFVLELLAGEPLEVCADAANAAAAAQCTRNGNAAAIAQRHEIPTLRQRAKHKNITMRQVEQLFNELAQKNMMRHLSIKAQPKHTFTLALAT